MKQLAPGLALVCSLAACGDNRSVPQPAVDAPPPGVIDAAIDGAEVEDCDPIAPAGQQGCATAEKCTWIQVEEMPGRRGRFGCVVDGTVALGGACTRGPAGEATGFDDCAAGGICIGSAVGGVCKDICGFDGSAAAGCDQGSMCTRYAGLGANDDEPPVIGACNPTCDPLHQTRIVNGQVQSCGAGQGCYLLSSTVDTIAICAGAGTVGAHEDIVGTAFANSCTPGLVPRQKVQGMTGNTCSGLCKPADVYMGHQEAYEGGDTRETNWMSPPRPASCESAGGAAYRPEVPGTGESCTFYWTREAASSLTNFSNTLGWCFNHASWKYDPDGMAPIDNTAAYPRCIATTTGDVLPPVSTPPHNDAIYFGCMALPSMLQGDLARRLVKKRFGDQPRIDRLGPYNE